MAALGTLPTLPSSTGSGSILGNTPGSSGSRPRRAQGAQSKPGVQPNTQQPGGSQPQTFAQMQAQGMARPAPPSQAPPPLGAPSPQIAPSQGTQGSASTAGPSSSGGTSGAGPNVAGQLQQGVSNALNAPSRYDLPQVQQVRDALTSQLQQQFGAQKKQLDEEMARRGISASSIAGGYQGDLAGQQSTALANMNAGLIQNQAATSAGDLSASLGAGQNYQTGQLASQLGLGNLGVAQQNANTAQTGTVGNLGIQAGGLTGNYNGTQTLGAQAQDLAKTLGLGGLGIQQGALTGVYNGDQTLGAQEAAASNALGFGNLMGSVNGQQTLGGQQLTTQQSQFQDQLKQALGIATMSDTTANRGIDAQAALSQNDLMLRVAQLLASMGVPTGAGAGGTGGNTSPTGGGSGSPAGGVTGGTGGTGGGTGGGGGGVTPIDPTKNILAPRTGSYSLLPGNGNDTGGTVSTGGSTLPQRQFPTFPSYQTPMFGNSGYTGNFGNKPVQWAGQQQTGATSGPGGVTLPLNTGSGPGPAPGQAPGGGPDSGGGGTLQSQVQGALTGGPGTPGYGASLPKPGDTPAQTFQRNTTPNAQTGAGPLSVGASSTGTDPQSLYAQGKIDYPTLQKMVAQSNGNSGAFGFSTGAMNNYTDDQLSHAITAQYQSLLDANRGNAQSARQAFLNPGSGPIDPRAAAMFNKLYPGS